MTENNEPKATQDLAPSRKKFETIFQHANDAIFIVDIENDDIVDCNPAAEELVEYSQEELQSMPASDLHPHNLPKFMDFADTVFEQGDGWTDDITCYCKSGDIIPAEMSASVIELDGRPHLVNHIRETSDRDEREWFETLLEHSSDLITVVKPDGTIRYQSPSVDTILGYTPDQLQDANYFEFLHPDDQTEIQERVQSMGSHSKPAVQGHEYRFRRADGTWIWLEGIISHRPDSSISGYLINARDITPRKESQQQAMVLNRILRHNLRNGLTVILNHADILRDAESDDVSKSAERIVTKAADLQKLTSYTKDLSDMLEAHHITQDRHDLVRLLDQESTELEETYPQISVDVDLPAECFVKAAPKLRLALQHVLTNAIEHNDSDSPRVDVTLEQPSPQDDYVKVIVADNGPGISSQERKVLLEGSEEPLEHGSGLGLWVVNWVVTRSGGYIAFDENEPRGSRVTIALQPVD